MPRTVQLNRAQNKKTSSRSSLVAFAASTAASFSSSVSYASDSFSVSDVDSIAPETTTQAEQPKMSAAAILNQQPTAEQLKPQVVLSGASGITVPQTLYLTSQYDLNNSQVYFAGAQQTLNLSPLGNTFAASPAEPSLVQTLVEAATAPETPATVTVAANQATSGNEGVTVNPDVFTIVPPTASAGVVLSTGLSHLRPTNMEDFLSGINESAKHADNKGHLSEMLARLMESPEGKIHHAVKPEEGRAAAEELFIKGKLSKPAGAVSRNFVDLVTTGSGRPIASAEATPAKINQADILAELQRRGVAPKVEGEDFYSFESGFEFSSSSFESTD